MQDSDTDPSGQPGGEGEFYDIEARAAHEAELGCPEPADTAWAFLNHRYRKGEAGEAAPGQVEVRPHPEGLEHLWMLKP